MKRLDDRVSCRNECWATLHDRDGTRACGGAVLVFFDSCMIVDGTFAGHTPFIILPVLNMVS